MKDFKETIKEYLEEYSKQDPLFLKKYLSEGKTLDECVSYILALVKKSEINGYTDEQVFKMARHYYNEKDIKVDKVESEAGRIIINKEITLTDEETAALKKEAFNKEVIDKQAKIVAKAKAKAEKEPTVTEQQSLF